MNATELAQAMLKWQELQEQADVLERQIVKAVHELGKTQTVGNVRATYSKPRKTYDYEAAWEQAEGINHKDDVLAIYAKPSYDYRKACEEYEIEEIPYKESPARVTLKIIA